MISEEAAGKELDRNSDSADDQSDGQHYGAKHFFNTEWGLVVLDEVQEAREPKTKRFQSAKKLAPLADQTLAMTATPMWNKPLDLLNILRVSGISTSRGLPGWKAISARKDINKKIQNEYDDCHHDYRDFAQFVQTLDNERAEIQRALKILPSTHVRAAEHPLEDWDILFPDGCPEDAKPLKEKWDSYTSWITYATVVVLDMARDRVVRRSRSDHLALRPHSEQMLSVDLNTQLRHAYDELCKQYQAAQRSDDGTDAEWTPQASEDVLLGSSLAAGFDIKRRLLLVSPRRVNPQYKDLVSPKVEEAVKICKKILEDDKAARDKNKRKILIYCEWSDPQVTASIALRFKQAGAPLAVLNGRVKETSKARIIFDFQQDRDHKASCGAKSRILLFSQCISSGVNLHRASVLIMLDSLWTFAKREQVEGRILRIGQTRPVSIYRLVCPNTIDEGMLFAQMRKSRLMNELQKEWGTRTTPFKPREPGEPVRPTFPLPGASAATTSSTAAKKRRSIDESAPSTKRRRSRDMSVD